MANKWLVEKVDNASSLYIGELDKFVGDVLEEVKQDPSDNTVLLNCGDRNWWFELDWLIPAADVPVVGNTKYNREIKPNVFVDVYDVLYAFKVTDPCLQHLIKKALAAGQRGHKDARQDLVDIRDSAQRALDSYDLWEVKE